MRLFISSLLTGLLLMTSNVQAELIKGNWNKSSYDKLNKLIKDNAFKKKKVIFDFDNTTVSRDIGEATFAYLIKNDIVKKDEKLRVISPSFMLGNEEVSIDTVTDLTDYYEKIVNSTDHKEDQAPYIFSYGWMVQAMQGMTVDQVVNATKSAYNNNFAINDRKNNVESKIEVTKGKTSYRVPFFHDETVDLIGNLILNDYDIYFVSGSNIWTIRYMTTVALPELLKKRFNKDLKIKPENIMGVNTLIKDKRNGKLYKDFFLVKENKKYASFDPKEIENYEITNQLVSPLSGFDGKTSHIMTYICKPNEKPFLALGDSTGDFSMLKYAENKVWFSRLESYDYQQKIAKIIKETDKNKWIIQPVLYKKQSGFVQNKEHLKTLIKDTKDFDNLYKSVKIFSESFGFGEW